MKTIAYIAVISVLLTAPAMAALMTVKEGDETAICDERAAAMVNPGAEDSVVFPQTTKCIDVEADSRERSHEENVPAIELAGYATEA